MARLAVFRSMHNVRPGERHLPSRAIELDPKAVAYLSVCEVEVGNAWATDRLTEVRKRLEAEAQLLHAYATDAEKGAADLRERVAARLASDPRHVALKQFIELAREAEARMMTLVYDEVSSPAG